MTTIRVVSIAALALWLGAGCSEGADTNPLPTWPPPGTPAGPGGTTDDDGQATFGVDTEGTAGSCCEAHGEPGCFDGVVEQCVCEQAPGCCSDGWSGACVSLVDELACGSCIGGPVDTGSDPDDTGPPPLGQDCCVGGSEPGCNDATIEACVCTEIPFCCDSGWEDVCASAVEALGCGHCGGAGETGDPPPPPPGETGDEPPPPPPGGSGDCCMDNGTPGCDDAAIEACVCMQDAYCCDTTWDQVCVDEVNQFGCGDCGGAMPPPGVSTCCSEQVGPGCDDPLIAACVCLVDDFCCTTQWDSVCAIFVELFLCGSCS